MCEQVRNKFDIEEQQVKDLLLVIKTITPVISLIREWGRTEKELSIAEEKENRLKEEVNAIDATIKLVKGDIVSALAEEHDKRCEVLREIHQKREKLENACEDFEGEIISYQEYIKDKKTINGRLSALEYGSLDKDMILALLFFIHYGCSSDKNEKSYFVKLHSREIINWPICQTSNLWKNVFMALKANEI